MFWSRSLRTSVPNSIGVLRLRRCSRSDRCFSMPQWIDPGSAGGLTLFWPGNSPRHKDVRLQARFDYQPDDDTDVAANDSANFDFTSRAKPGARNRSETGRPGTFASVRARAVQRLFEREEGGRRKRQVWSGGDHRPVDGRARGVLVPERWKWVRRRIATTADASRSAVK